MEEIEFDFENKEYNEVIYKIILKSIDLKDLEPYFLENISKDKKQNILYEIKNIDSSSIAPEEIILETKDFFKDSLKKEFSDYMVNYLIGYKELTPIMDNDDYEEIMVNDYNSVFVISRRNVYYKTNITFDKTSFNIFLEYIKKTLNNDFKKRDFIDGILPDNSRVNIISKKVAKFNVITIRKYLRTPLTIVDLINSNTISYEVATYLWIIVDGFGIKPANVFICGGTSTGKTTLLNILLNFINSKTRVIGVEDTREIDFSMFENHVSLTSNISDPDSLYNITTNILRMRPDRIIIGETRGKEAKALFMAMATGHQGCISTIHANNCSDLINKLSSNPMNIEDVYIKLLDVVVTFNKKIIGNKMYRYVSEIAEISRMGNITINKIYLNENMNDNISVNFMSSTFLENLCKSISISKFELEILIENRMKVLKTMVENNLNDSDKIKDIISDPRLNFRSVLHK
jgi:archaeal flagellar protein FlaI